jgi:predicted P-loop ATPase
VADIDFKALAQRLLDNAESLLAAWFPNGVASGHEFKIGSVEGEAGDSLSVNMNTGQWADFAGRDKGGDLIALYAAFKGLSQLDAARELQGETARMLAVPPSRPKAPRKTSKWTPILPVPDDTPDPPDRFSRNEGTPKAARWVPGEFVRRWTYHDADGRVLGHVARFHWPKPEGGVDKDVVPQTWCEDEAGVRKWRTRSFPVPRPLYGLRELAQRPDAPVLIVEGEKSTDAAREIAPQYVVITWPGGAEAWRKAALNPLRGRTVLLWPDADEPGTKAMWEVGHELLKQCPTVKIILPDGKPDGWDAFDARAEGWGWQEFKEWALPRVVLVTETGAGNERSSDTGRPEAANASRRGTGAGPADQAGDRAHGAGAGQDAADDTGGARRGDAAHRRGDGPANGGPGRRGAGDPERPGAATAQGEAPAAAGALAAPPAEDRRPDDGGADAEPADAGPAAPDRGPAPGPGDGAASGGESATGGDDPAAARRDHEGGAGDRDAPAVRGGGSDLRAAAGSAGPQDREPSGQAGTQVAATGGADQGQSQVSRWLAWGLDRNGNGVPLANLNNAVAILEHDPRLQGLLWFDEFLQRMLTGDPVREWTEADDGNLTLYMQRAIGVQKMGIDSVRQAARIMAYRNVRNCVRDWLSSLTWDRTPRIEAFFVDIFGADDTAYTRAAGRNFWISLVARALNPGCQVDNMVVLEGTQGIQKSSALQIIAGDWYAAQHESPGNMRAFAEVLQGKIIAEIEEMHAFSRVENEAIKKAITVRKDRFRPSGAHGYAKDHPRTCIFAGTTNRDDWNKDETGARRQWPIRCEFVELELLRANREQYFAEAVGIYRRVHADALPAERVAAGAAWWLMPEEETKAEQAARYDADPWMDQIAKFVAIVSSATVGEIMEEALKIEIARFTRSDQMRVAACLRVLGWKQKNSRVGGRVLKVWYPPAREEATSDQVATGGYTQVVDSSIPF